MGRARWGRLPKTGPREGLRHTRPKGTEASVCASKCHRLILRSSAERCFMITTEMEFV